MEGYPISIADDDDDDSEKEPNSMLRKTLLLAASNPRDAPTMMPSDPLSLKSQSSSSFMKVLNAFSRLTSSVLLPLADVAAVVAAGSCEQAVMILGSGELFEGIQYVHMSMDLIYLIRTQLKNKNIVVAIESLL